MKKCRTSLMLVLCLAIVLVSMVGCGGGGGDTAPAPTASTAVGIWKGTTNTNRSVIGIVLDNGIFYVLYSKQNSPNSSAGVVEGNATINNGTISSTNAKDFNFGDGLGIVNVGMSGTYTAKQALNGSIAYGGNLGTATFTTTYSTDYDLTPSLSLLAGSFAGSVVTSVGVENATLAVTSSGAISGAGASGCQVSGSVATHSTGNAYDFTLSFGGAPCHFANQTFTGNAYYDATMHKLYAAAPNSARTDGILFIGNK